MKLPVVSGSEAIKAFRRVGYEFDEQHGSHIILRHAEAPHRRLSVPKGLSKNNLYNCGAAFKLRADSSALLRRLRQAEEAG